MQHKQDNASLAGPVILIIVLLDAIMLKKAFIANNVWSWLIIVSFLFIFILIINIARHRRHTGKPHDLK